MKFKEFVKNSRLRPWDIPIILLLCLLSFLPLVIFGITRQSPATTESKIAVLRINGDEVKRFSLVDGKKSYTYRYENEDGDYNVIEVDGEKVRIIEADCGDQVCVRRGWAEKDGDTIVCLPHKLVIEIQDGTGGGDDGLIY
ncbi:NusG domain II-containing protein [Enterococcus asini]|uniref:NusG domain II-containing protein n=1 Tax=Enterococcus asini TaxID=57732 RepID=UPI0022E49C19|nr:NusG domain II-containing protein [Enterococcus asini]